MEPVQTRVIIVIIIITLAAIHTIVKHGHKAAVDYTNSNHQLMKRANIKEVVFLAWSICKLIAARLLARNSVLRLVVLLLVADVAIMVRPLIQQCYNENWDLQKTPTCVASIVETSAQMILSVMTPQVTRKQALTEPL